MKAKITILVLVAIILVAARICYVTLFPPVPPETGVAAIAEKARAEGKSGGEFLHQLAKEGRLPGINKGDHGNMSAQAGKVSYPYSITFQFVKTGDTSKCNYTIVQLAKDSEWKLKRAWRSDSTGKVVEEWTVQ